MGHQEKSVVEHRSVNSLFLFSHLKPESHNFSVCHLFASFTHLEKGTGVGRGRKTSFHSLVHISCRHCQWYFSRFLSIFQSLTFLWADIQLQIRPSVITHQYGSVKCGYSIQHEDKKQNMKEISDISDLWLIMVKPKMCLPYRKI